MHKTQETRPKTLRSLGQEDPLKKKMATHCSILFFPHSSILPWRTPWREEPGRLQSLESQGVRHDCSNLAWQTQGGQASPGGSDSQESAGTAGEIWVWSLDWEYPLEKGMATHPLWYSCPDNFMNRGAWRATVRGVTKSGTWLSD